MPVSYLELENFKSYAGLQRIGPFKDFTCIIGPNGAGKSNVMDAIAFLFGVQSRELRSSQLKDLIFRPPGKIKTPLKLKATATLVYEDTESNEEYRFSRSVTPGGVGEYKVDGKVVSFADYEKQLSEIGVLLKARNFLVFQGDVESIARKTPKELVEMLEQISTSAELKDAYTEAMKAKEEAENATIFAFNKQKGYKSERRLLKDQKEEAERFHDLLDKKSQLRTDMYLWSLYHIHVDMEAREKNSAELREDLGSLEQEEASAAKVVKEAKKKASAARRETSSTDKKRMQLATEVDKLEPSVIQTTEEIKSLNKKVQSDKRNLSKLQSEMDRHEMTLKETEKEIAEYRETQAQLEADYEEVKQSAASQGSVALTAQQEEEFERVKEAAAAASDQHRRNLTSLRRKLDSARAKASNTTYAFQELKERRDDAAKQVKEFADRKETLTKSMATTKTELRAAEKELQEAQKTVRDSQARREVIDAEVEKIARTLRDARDVRSKNKEERRLLQAIESLKKHFVGVRGRLVDLCRPTQRRFNLAVTVAAGKDMDAIVVDTKKVAFDCIQYLRDQRVGVATFLPLDSLKVPSPESTERIRAMTQQDNRYRLASDVISCDEGIKQAVLYSVGNTVVCDDLDAARELCFGGRTRRSEFEARVKAVTLQGGVISKAGTMTGGVTNADTSRAGRWDDSELEKLRTKRDELEVERSELEGLGNLSKLDELRNIVGNLQHRSQFGKSDLDYTTKSLAERKTLLKSLDKQLSESKKQGNKCESDIRELDSSVQDAIKAVKAAEDEHLGPFCEATGMHDVQAYEEVMRNHRDDFNKKKGAVMEHITKLEQQLEYESNRDFTKPIERAEKRMKNRQKSLADAKKKEESFLKQVDEAKEKLNEAARLVKEAATKEKELDEQVQRAQQEFSEAQSRRNDTSKAIASEESALERLRGKLHETLQKSRVEEVDLPRIGAKNSEPKRRSGRISRSQVEEEDEDEPMEDVEESGSSQRTSSAVPTQETGATTHFSQDDDARVVKDRQAAAKIDFSKMKSELKQRVSDRDERKMRKDFEDQIAKVIAEIETMTPNMKAAEAFDTVTERLKESGSDFEKAKTDARKAALAFQKVKNQRAKRFNDAFDHIDEALKTIYTDMTKSSKHPLGGNAYLSLDDTEEPYKGGMKFNAMPPMKRFRDMEQLSGGEKTVAALSLLFAIHSFRPAPFFVMDEVDAALDNVNLRKVCNYISQRSQTDFQCIVISLKDMFYEKSQSLVGICRDVGTGSSRTLTLDLTKFADESVVSRSSLGSSERKRRISSVGSARKRHRSDISEAMTTEGSKADESARGDDDDDEMSAE